MPPEVVVAASARQLQVLAIEAADVTPTLAEMAPRLSDRARREDTTVSPFKPSQRAKLRGAVRPFLAAGGSR